jgi:4a-hydroxytetrahydrobiopterin dehydratase
MTLTHAQIEKLPDRLPGWTVEDKALSKQFTFPAFPDAVAFVTRLAFDAEAADHHPDLQLSYRRVTVTWSTHSADALTEKDVAGAEQTEAIIRTSPAAAD